MTKRRHDKGYGRFQNINILLIGIVNILFSIKVLFQTSSEGITLVSQSKLFFGYLPLIVGLISVIIAIYILIKPSNNKINKFKKILKTILIIFLTIFIFEYIIFTTINSFINVSILTRIPNKENFLDSMTFIVINYYDDFLKGVLVTLELSLVGTVIGLILGLIFVIFRTLEINENDSEIIAFLKKIGIVFTKLYVNVFRGTPMMVQAVIIYYLLPVILANQLKIPQAEVDQFFTLIVAGIVIVSLNTTAYLTEVLRGGIESVDKGQLEAARSLGMSYWQSMVHVVLPQAIKNSLPAIGNEFIINIKDTAVLNVIGVAELFFMAQDAKYKYFRTYEPFIIVALIYLFLTLSTSKLLGIVEKKMNVTTRHLPSSN